MINLVVVPLTAVAALLFLICAVLAAEIAAAIAGRRNESSALPGSRPECRIAVLVPAHDEAAGIASTLAVVQGQLGASDRLLVVADNCSDATAEIARAQGAEVVERRNPERRGKGYALDFGVDHLRERAPDVVIVLDADCIVAPGAVAWLADAALAAGTPVQAAYLMQTASDASLKQRTSAFAFRVKNLVRFAGAQRLRLPCPLAGTGMAFPWRIIAAAPLASGNIVEDMQLGIDLAVDGHPARFEPRARVTSHFPAGVEGQETQRRRWEQGHLATIASQVPRLLGEAVRQRRLDLAGMALDLLVPPLSLLVLALAAVVLLSAILFFWGIGGLALTLSGLAAGAAAVMLVAAWHFFARDLLSPGDLLAIPGYVLWKLPLYLGALRGGEKQWIRSARHHDDGVG